MPGLVDERPYWSLSETRKSELVGGPDMSHVQGARSLSFLGNQILGNPTSSLVDDQTYWCLAESRKSELVGDPHMSEWQGTRSLSSDGIRFTGEQPHVWPC